PRDFGSGIFLAGVYIERGPPSWSLSGGMATGRPQPARQRRSSSERSCNRQENEIAKSTRRNARPRDSTSARIIMTDGRKGCWPPRPLLASRVSELMVETFRDAISVFCIFTKPDAFV